MSEPFRPEGFELNVSTLELFFRVCRRYHVPDDARDIKTHILRMLVKKKKAKYISNPSEYLKHKNVKEIQ